MDRFCLIPLQINKSAFFAPSEWNMLTLLSRVQDDLTWRDPYLRSTLDWRDGDNYFLISCLHLLSSSSTSSGYHHQWKRFQVGVPPGYYISPFFLPDKKRTCVRACVSPPWGVRCDFISSKGLDFLLTALWTTHLMSRTMMPSPYLNHKEVGKLYVWG